MFDEFKVQIGKWVGVAAMWRSNPTDQSMVLNLLSGQAGACPDIPGLHLVKWNIYWGYYIILSKDNFMIDFYILGRYYYETKKSR